MEALVLLAVNEPLQLEADTVVAAVGRLAEVAGAETQTGID